jgi:hypothetical protein
VRAADADTVGVVWFERVCPGPCGWHAPGREGLGCAGGVDSDSLLRLDGMEWCSPGSPGANRGFPALFCCMPVCWQLCVYPMSGPPHAPCGMQGGAWPAPAAVVGAVHCSGTQGITLGPSGGTPA